MSFADDATPNNASSSVITKEGRGLVQEGLKITPSELYFGALVIGEDQLSRSFSVTNIGRKTLRIKSVVLETESNQFSLAGVAPQLLRSGESFSMEAKYESNQPGLVVGVVYIDTSEDREPYKVTLSGRVISSLYLEEFYDEFSAQLQQESWARATADEAEAGQRLLLKAELGDEISAKIQQERIARVTMFEANASDIQTLEATVTGNTAEIASEKIVRANADNAIASRLDVLEATTGNPLEESEVRAWIQEEASVRSSADAAEALAREMLGATLNDAIIDVDALIVEERHARVTAISAEANAREALSSSIYTNLTGINSAITNEATVRSLADSALAERITVIEAETDGIDYTARASIEEERLARIDGDEAEANARTALGASLTNGITGAKSEAQALVAVEQEARVTAISAVASSVQTVSAQISLAGGNLIENSEFTTGLQGWNIYQNTNPPHQIAKSPAQYTLNNTGNGLQLFCSGPPISGTVGQVYYAHMPVKGNTPYQVSGRIGMHRANGEILLEWLREDNSVIWVDIIDYMPDGEYSGGTTLDKFGLYGGFATSPSDAVRLNAHFRKGNTKLEVTPEYGSYLFVIQPMVKEARVGQTILDPYIPGTSLSALNTSVTQSATAIAGIGARWTANVTAGGLIGGFSVYNNGNNVGAWFDVDNFYIGRNQQDGSYPFEVVNGVVNIRTAVIGTARITHLQLAGGSVSISNAAAFNTNITDSYGSIVGVQITSPVGPTLLTLSLTFSVLTVNTDQSQPFWIEGIGNLWLTRNGVAQTNWQVNFPAVSKKQALLNNVYGSGIIVGDGTSYEVTFVRSLMVYGNPGDIWGTYFNCRGQYKNNNGTSIGNVTLQSGNLEIKGQYK